MLLEFAGDKLGVYATRELESNEELWDENGESIKQKITSEVAKIWFD